MHWKMIRRWQNCHSYLFSSFFFITFIDFKLHRCIPIDSSMKYNTFFRWSLSLCERFSVFTTHNIRKSMKHTDILGHYERAIYLQSSSFTWSQFYSFSSPVFFAATVFVCINNKVQKTNRSSCQHFVLLTTHFNESHRVYCRGWCLCTGRIQHINFMFSSMKISHGSEQHHFHRRFNFQAIHRNETW